MSRHFAINNLKDLNEFNFKRNHVYFNGQIIPHSRDLYDPKTNRHLLVIDCEDLSPQTITKFISSEDSDKRCALYFGGNRFKPTFLGKAYDGIKIYAPNCDFFLGGWTCELLLLIIAVIIISNCKIYRARRNICISIIP
jgi:hypothetical protein